MSQFQYLPITFSDQNGLVSALTSPLGSNVLSPQVYGPIGLSSLSFFGTVDVNTGAAGTFTAEADDDLLTKANNGFYTGLIVRVSNSGGALPAPLLAATDYFVIRVSASTFYLAETLADALNAVHIDLEDDGTGTNTVTPTALASALIKLQGSYDGSVWVDIPNSSTTITADASFGPIEVPYIYYPYIRAYASLASGSMAFSNIQIGYRGE